MSINSGPYMSINTAYTGDFCFVYRADQFEITGVTGNILGRYS